MEEKYPGNCLPIGADNDAYKEKMADVTAATLCRLNSIMKQMRNWRDDRVKLRSNIWRLKLALRVAGRETDDTLHADPLIEHQRAEIKQLRAENQSLRKEIADIKTLVIEEDPVAPNAWESDKQDLFVEKERLNNEILYLQSRLKEVEEGHEHSSEIERLKCKLKHFMMVDHTMEIIFTDIVNKVAETMANLSEELVNVSKQLYASRSSNDNLYQKIDKLNAMLRSKNGNVVDYRERIVELDNLTKQLKSELRTFKVNLRDKLLDKSSDYQNNVKNAERLVNDLRIKLRNDHEAMLAAGDPDCLSYIKRIIELRLTLKQLHVELSKSTVSISSMDFENTTEYEYVNQISILEFTLKEIDIEIYKLKDDRVTRHSKFGGVKGKKYLNKIEELQTIVEKTRITMKGSNEGKDIKKLEDFVDKMCRGIKQLEVIVASDDSLSLFARIDQLEESIVRLKVESSEKDERANVWRQKLQDAETLHKQRAKELKDTRRKVDTMTDENKTLKGRTEKMEERMSELQREHESTKRELEQLRHVKNEANLTRKKLQNLQADKEGLLKETGRLRDTLQRRNDEIKLAITEKDAMEKTLNAKIMDIGRNLQVVSKEKIKLLSKLNNLERFERPRESSEDNDARLQQLKADLETSRKSLNNANCEIIDLKAKFDHFSDDKARMEASISRLESKKEMLLYQLGVEKTTAEEKLKELTRLASDNDKLNDERVNLENKMEQLRIELTDSRTEKELLKNSLENANAKYSKLEDEVNEWKFERNVLREEIRNFEINTNDLTTKLKDTRMQLDGAGDKIKVLESENSKYHCNLDALALENAGFEDRVQALLKEKNDLVTRINELDRENVSTKDQLNKVKKENEYSVIELNKLRMEYEKARTENASLLDALDGTKKMNETLEKSTGELKTKLNEIHSEYRVLENQLKIFETTNSALEKEKQMLYREYVASLQSGIPKAEKERAAIVDEIILNEHGDQMCENPKFEKRISDKSKTKNARDELKKLIVENEALKFELVNLRNQNIEMKMKLLRAKEEFLRQKMEFAQNERIETAIMPIMNLCYKEINSYSGQYPGNAVGVLACIDQRNVRYCGSSAETKVETEIEKLLEIMNKLKIENVALKMELNTLRCKYVANFAEDETRRNEHWNALEEIRALKTELTKLRDEKESLRARLDIAGTKLNQLESEKAALKNELYTLRKINSNLERTPNDL